jgi:hypothetical protein
MWAKEDGFTEREEYSRRPRGPEGTNRAYFVNVYGTAKNGLRKNSLFFHSERSLRSEESAFSLAFCEKQIPRFARGMTTNCDSSAACKNRALPKIASGVTARRPSECATSESQEAEA